MTEIQNRFLDFCKKEQPAFIPTDAQKKALFDNVNIVAAGAGSGKTAVLSHRFLYLVMTGIHCDEILTMTFTKDATANMKKKIYNLLSKAVDAHLVDKKELDRFSRATISTTDGFCSEIAKSASSNYGISSRFQIESNEDTALISDSITEDLLKVHQDDKMLHTLLDFWSVDSLKDFLHDLADSYIAISRPIDFSLYKNQVVKEFGKYTELGLDNLIEDFLDYVAKNSKPSETLLKNSFRLSMYQKERSTETLIDIMSISSSVSNEIKPVVNGIKDYAKKYITVHPACLALLDFMIQFFGEFQSAIYKHKRETGNVTYRDILLMSIDILNDNSDIRSYYQNKFKAIMVDEFQDNNSDNKTLVYQIAGKNTDSVFMVGDEKQSIYSFRGADVSVFKNMIEDFGQEKVAQLQQNYRSEGKLIDTINQIFEKVFEGASAQYEASYTPLVSSNANVKPKVAVFYNIDDETKQTRTSEADNIACVIERILGPEKSEYQIPSKDGLRDPKPGDIAILLKVGTHQIYYEKALRRHKIPFEAIENKSLTLDAVANDFYNILQLAVWGDKDEIALFGLKNSPLGNNKTNDEQKQTVSMVRRKLASGKIAETLSFIWNELGYRFFILRNEMNHQYEEHYDFLFALATKYDQNERTIIDFLDYLRPMLGSDCNIKEVQIQREVESGVKVMSIHKSKGLEFPIVIIPDMQSGSSSPGGFKPNIRLNGNVLSFPYAFDSSLFNPMIDKDEDARKELAETKRVFYVAATRAQYHLVMSGILKSNNSMMALLKDAVDFENNQGLDIDFIPYKNQAVSYDEDCADYITPSDSWYKDTYDFKFKKLTTAITSLDNEKITKFDCQLPEYECDKVISNSAEFGTYVHEIMERTINGINVDNFFGSFVNNENRGVIQKDALTMRDGFINSSFFKSLNGYELLTEQGFFYYDSSSTDVMEGIVDLLCIGKEKIVIVDYKTDKFKDPSTHKAQLETYIHAMSAKYNKPVEAYLFYLRSGAVVLM